jgi:hypothetical protein
MENPMFKLGNCVITPAAMEFFNRASITITPQKLIQGHHDGSLWGQNKEQNEKALTLGDQVFTSTTVDGEMIFIITEADRSSTCVLLASDY